LELQDRTSTGKVRPWVPRKEQSLGVAPAYLELARRGGPWAEEYARIGEAMMACGTSLEFACACCAETGDRQKRLCAANFCRGRLCPMCNWRRVQRVGNELGQVVAEFQRRNDGSVLVMLTVTERNPRDWQLSEALDGMSAGFAKLRKRKAWKRAVRAWFRIIEVTRPRPGEFHPHMHILLLVDARYFNKRHDLYISQPEWARLWADCRGLDYAPVVDVRRMRRTSEATKYCTKVMDYLSWRGAEGWVADVDTVGVLHRALKGRRLVAWSGELAAVRKDLGKKDDDELVDDGNGFPPGYEITHREVYYWSPATLKRGRYVLGMVLPPKEGREREQESEEAGSGYRPSG